MLNDNIVAAFRRRPLIGHRTSASDTLICSINATRVATATASAPRSAHMQHALRRRCVPLGELVLAVFNQPADSLLQLLTF